MLTLLLVFLYAQPHSYGHPVCSATAPASSGFVTIHGRVSDQTGAPIRQAMVRLQTGANASSQYARADRDGCYQIAARSGSYLLRAQAQGFFIASNNIMVGEKTNKAFDLTLTVESGGGVDVTPDPADKERQATVPSMEICFTDPQGMPADPVLFKLENASLPKRVYTAKRSYGWDSPPWGCGFVENVAPGDYMLSADALGFEHFQENFTISPKPSFPIQIILVPKKL